MKKLFAGMACSIVFVACQLKGATEGAEGQALPLPAKSQTSVTNLNMTPGVAEKERVLWEGRIADGDLRWTDYDLYFLSDGRRTSLWRDNVSKEFFEMSSGWSGMPHCNYYRKFKILSIVGSLATIYDLESVACGSHSELLKIQTVDLSASKKLPSLHLPSSGDGVSLRDLFAADEIFRALTSNQTIKAFLQTRDTRSTPKTLDDLVRVIGEEYDQRVAGDYALGNELSSFAFLKIAKDDVVVRLFLMPTSGYNAETTKYLDVLLPIPNSLEQPLRKADKLENGFLIDSQPKSAKDRYTEFRGSYPQEPPSANATE